MALSVGTKRGNYKRREDYIASLLRVLRFPEWIGADEVKSILGVDKHYVFMQRYVLPALEDGYIEVFFKSFPAITNQLFRKTNLGALKYGC